MKLEGQDVLRAMDEPPQARDKVEELRAARAVLHAHYKSNLDASGDLVERIVRVIVFQGCAPALLLIFMFLLGVLWVLGIRP